MKKPKIKKRKNYWLVYQNKKQTVKCFSEDSARLWCAVLLHEKERTPPKKELYATYAPHTDTTFIMQDEINEHSDPTSTECVGWYFGEPTEENTQFYIGKLKAHYEW